MLSIFSCVFAHLYVFLEKCLFKSAATFWLGCFGFFCLFVFFLVLNYLSGLYILEIYTLSVTSFENTISHSVDCLFVLFMVSFAVQKLLNLIRSHLFIFVFIFITLGGRSKKILLWFMSARIVAFYSLQHPWLNTLQAWHCFLCCVLITSLLLVDSF